MIKPHLFKRFGYWRVSRRPKPYGATDKAWHLAHLHAIQLNNKLRE